MSDDQIHGLEAIAIDGQGAHGVEENGRHLIDDHYALQVDQGSQGRDTSADSASNTRISGSDEVLNDNSTLGQENSATTGTLVSERK